MSESLFMKNGVLYCHDKEAGELLWEMTEQEVFEMRRENEELRAERDELRGMLRELEFSFDDYWCPVCLDYKTHKPDCRLATLLKEEE